MKLEYVVYLLLGLLLGLAGYAAASLGWYANMWWQNHPTWPLG